MNIETLLFDGGKLNGAFGWWMSTPTDEVFLRLADYVLDRADKTRRRIFIDRDAPWLFVAHVDTVVEPRIKKVNRRKQIITGAGFDDRLGCYLAYVLSKHLGADLLLCDLEESLESTGQYHDCKDYRFIVEFDRGGTDVVTYDRDNEEFRESLSAFWTIGFGSSSDISTLSTTACCVNVGIGYYLAHSQDSYIKPKEVASQVDKFLRWFDLNKDTAFVADEPLPARRRAIWWRDYDGWAPAHFDENVCDLCGAESGQYVHGYFIGENCFNALMDAYLADETGAT